MAKCSSCGFDLPEEAAFCPNCGEPVKKIMEIQKKTEGLERIIRLSLVGVFLSLIISSVIAVSAEGFEPYFIPTFISALIVIYISRTKNLKDAIIISALIYLITDALLSGLLLGTLYAQGMKLASYYSAYYKDAPTLIDVILYAISPVTAILAGFVGYKIAPRKGVYGGRPGEEHDTLFYGVKGPLKKLKYVFLGFFIGAK